MRESHLYYFQETHFLRIGKLLADRDAFIVFFQLAKSLGPLNIQQLT
jgi:hypothetical protein